MPISDSSKQVKFLFFDGTVAAPLILIILWPSLTMLYILIAFSILLIVLSRHGIKLNAIFRMLRVFLVGRYRYIRPWWRSNF